MQFLIDTATDSPNELYKIGRFLVDQFETVPVPTGMGEILSSPPSAPPPTGFMTPLPQFPGTSDDIISADDPEIEIDSEGGFTVSTELPPARPADSMFLPAPLPAPPGPAVPAELDSRGMPWDSRVHASNRSKKIDGSWKSKRGVDPNLVAACEAQNKPGNGAPAAAMTTPNATAVASSVGTIPQPVPSQTASISAVPSVPATNPPALSGAQAAALTFGHMAPPPPAATSPLTAAVPVSPALVMAPPPPPPAPTVSSTVLTTPTVAATTAPPASIDFRGLMQKIQAASAAGKLTPDQVNAALAGVGLKPEEMAQLINNAPLIASVNAAVEACLA